MSSIETRLKQAIRDVPDFPKEGILFKDITPIMSDPLLMNDVIEAFMERSKGMKLDAIAGVESRGFLFGMPLAMRMGLPFITIRKKGKLPYDTVSYSYDLEYGSATIEMHVDEVKPGMRVMVHDDLLATGGTANATAQLIEQQGGEVACFSFLVELGFLNGRRVMGEKEIMSLVSF